MANLKLSVTHSLTHSQHQLQGDAIASKKRGTVKERSETFTSSRLVNTRRSHPEIWALTAEGRLKFLAIMYVPTLEAVDNKADLCLESTYKLVRVFHLEWQVVQFFAFALSQISTMC